jgi:regulator of PEP synthase PpsR (kinase-PPPase family)
MFHLHLVSDSTGETLNSVSRACLVQFEHVVVEEHHWNLIRSKRQLDLVLEGIRQWPGLVLYTFVDEQLRLALLDFCRRSNVQAISVLDPVMQGMTDFFGTASAQAVGKQHKLDAEYFARIEAMDFALAFDDGNKTDLLEQADVVVLGVSRTSKTPTCLYLANRGIKAANIPLIPDLPLPVDLALLKKPLIVGLVNDPTVLVEVRRTRLRFLQQKEETSYVDAEKVRDEVLQAKRLFARLGCPVIDVTRRSIEETAAEILTLLDRRHLQQAIGTSA